MDSFLAFSNVIADSSNGTPLLHQVAAAEAVVAAGTERMIDCLAQLPPGHIASLIEILLCKGCGVDFHSLVVIISYVVAVVILAVLDSI